jgi:hypothetical protein
MVGEVTGVGTDIMDFSKDGIGRGDKNGLNA